MLTWPLHQHRQSHSIHQHQQSRSLNMGPSLGSPPILLKGPLQELSSISFATRTPVTVTTTSIVRPPQPSPTSAHIPQPQSSISFVTRTTVTASSSSTSSSNVRPQPSPISAHISQPTSSSSSAHVDSSVENSSGDRPILASRLRQNMLRNGADAFAALHEAAEMIKNSIPSAQAPQSALSTHQVHFVNFMMGAFSTLPPEKQQTFINKTMEIYLELSK